jgi:hypothetical protein
MNSSSGGGIARERREAAAIEQEFPGWVAWVGITDSRWHAMKRGVTPEPGMIVSDDDPEGLREEITRWISQHDT